MEEHVAETSRSQDHGLASEKVIQDEVDDEKQGDEGATEDYEVEKVVGHKRENKVLSYLLKWKGYNDNESTWVTNDNLSCARLVRAYWGQYEAWGGKKTDVLGHNPTPPLGLRSDSELTIVATKPSTSAVARCATAAKATVSSIKKVTRNVNQSTEPAAKKQKVVAMATRPMQTEGKKPTDDQDKGIEQQDGVLAEGGGVEGESGSDWKPPRSWTSWENEVSHIQALEQSKREMVVHLAWKNGKETEHPITDAHEKCPQKLIKFYESRIRFVQQSSM